MSLHTYNRTNWKNAPDHKTTPINADNLNNIEQGMVNAYSDIAEVAGDVEDLDADKTEKSNIAPVEASATASQAHATGSQFYFNGQLVIATANISAGGTIVLGGNCLTSDNITTQINSCVSQINNCVSQINDCKTFTQDNLDGYNKLIGFKNNAGLRELYFNDYSYNTAAINPQAVGSSYIPTLDVIFPIMAVGYGIINVRIKAGTGVFDILDGNGGSLSGVYRLIGHTTYIIR